jgi:hypothetical protein
MFVIVPLGLMGGKGRPSGGEGRAGKGGKQRAKRARLPFVSKG